MSESSNAEPATESVTDEPRDTRTGSLVVIFLTVFIDLLGWGIVLPLLPIYAEKFAGDAGIADEYVGVIVGLLFSVFSLMQFFFLPIWGRLSDRFGRRPIILIGLASSAFFYLLFGWATVGRSLLGLFIARTGQGIAGATISTAQAYIADTTDPENRQKGMALIGAAFGLGFALGPMIGAVALLVGGDLQLSPWPSYTAAGLSLVAFVLAIFLLPESLRKDSESAARPLFDVEGIQTALATPTLPALMLASFIAIFSFANFESSLARQLELIGSHQAAHPEPGSFVAWVVGVVKNFGYDKPGDVKLIIVYSSFAFIGLVLMIVQGVIVRRLSGIVTEMQLAATGSIFAIVGFLLLAYAAHVENLPLLFGAMAIEVGGFALVNPSLQALISRRSDPAKQGSILGLAQSTMAMARILGPIVGNAVFRYSPIYPYFIATCFMLIASGMIFFGIEGGHDYVQDPRKSEPLVE